MNRLKNIWRPRTMVFVFIHFVDKTPEISAVKCRMKAAGPEEVEQPGRFDTLEEVIAHYGKSRAYHLHVVGSGVLSRRIESLPNYMDELVINGNPDEFIFSVYDDGSALLASFFRRSAIGEMLEQLGEQKIHLLGISAGLSPVLCLAEDLHIHLDHSLVKEQGKIVSFGRAEKASQRTQFEGSFVTAEQLIIAGLIRQYMEPCEEYMSSEVTHFAPADENYRQFNQFRIMGVVIVSGILLALVVNYFYVNHLNSQIAQLETDLSVSNENLALLNRLEEEKTRKEQLVLNAGVNSPRFLSYYLDEIGKTVPEQINLQELLVFPLEGKMKNKQKVEVNREAIRIAGSTPDNEVLDDWIERMDRFEWVKGIELMNYLKNEGNRSDFLIMITLAK